MFGRALWLLPVLAASAAVAVRFEPLFTFEMPRLQQGNSISFSPGGERIAVDAAGNLWFANITYSDIAEPYLCGQPVLRPLQACGPFHLRKSDSRGRLLFGSYFGGPGPDRLQSIAADARGDLVLLWSAANQPSGSILTKIASDGSRVVFSKPLSSDRFGFVSALGIDRSGTIVVASNLDESAVVVYISPDGTQITRGVEISRIPPQQPVSLAVAPKGETYVLLPGRPAFPLTETFSTLVKIGPGGKEIEWRRIDLPALPEGAILTASEAGVWVAGVTFWAQVPTTPNAFQRRPSTPSYGRGAGSPVGFEWPEAAPSARQFLQFRVHPRDPELIYASTEEGIFVSEDDGISWEPRSRDSSFRGARVLPDPGDAAVVRATAGGKLYTSRDRGRNWAVERDDYPENAVTDPTNPSNLYVPVNGGLRRSSDAGKSWEFVPVAPPAELRFLAVDPAEPSIVYAAGATVPMRFPVFGILSPSQPLLFRSNDGGRTFLTPVPFAQGIQAIEFDPFEPSSLFVHAGDLYRVRRSGFPAVEPFMASIAQFAFHPARAGVMVAMQRSRNSPANMLLLSERADPARFRSAGFAPLWTSVIAVSSENTIHAGAGQPTRDSFALRFGAAGDLEYGSYAGGATGIEDAAITPSGRLIALAREGACRPASQSVAAIEPDGEFSWSCLDGTRDPTLIHLAVGGGSAYATGYSFQGPNIGPVGQVFRLVY